ncbi:GNAT family N-acetyltransferase [Paenibacillus tengchongensis]|uniref:GNAT family N-acetyltransferase n=1 Tax=Paenibacillus tengchongensis TaxID=2608684 RepID=UPI001652B4DA|nr:GNAT family N-acetyltransferase [Paenibacillus tengchongensis]
MILETERLFLRPYDREDLNRLHDLLSDPVTMEFWPAPFTLEQSQQWLRQSMETYPSGLGRLGVFCKSNGSFIGDAGLRVSELDGKQEMDLGYIIQAANWRQGYGLEAARAVLRYGVEELGLKRICANMPVHHHGSRRVAMDLGMILEKEFLNARNRNIQTCLYVTGRNEE